MAAGVIAIASLKYIQVVWQSQEKWFHFAIMAMMAFGGFQLHQFYLNQKEIESKIDDLKQRSKQQDTVAANPQVVEAPSPIEVSSPDSPSKKKVSIKVEPPVEERKSPTKEASTAENSAKEQNQ